MRSAFTISIVVAIALGAGCAGGCGPLGWDDDVRPEQGGTPPAQDVVVIDSDDVREGSPDGGRAGSSDAAEPVDHGQPDAGGNEAEPDVGGDVGDMWTAVCGDGDVHDTEACDDGNTSDGDYCAADCSATTGSCGDGVLQQNEACDDGVTADCSSTDGGEGTCVVAGTCSDGYVDDGTECVPELMTQHVHIHVANDCTMMVDPPEFTVPRGQKVRFSWHNHSQSYPVDVWQSYIGGYTDLAPGATWDEQFEWCANVTPYTGYSDITTNQACPSHRFYIYCNGQ